MKDRMDNWLNITIWRIKLKHKCKILFGKAFVLNRHANQICIYWATIITLACAIFFRIFLKGALTFHISRRAFIVAIREQSNKAIRDQGQIKLWNSQNGTNHSSLNIFNIFLPTYNYISLSWLPCTHFMHMPKSILLPMPSSCHLVLKPFLVTLLRTLSFLHDVITLCPITYT